MMLTNVDALKGLYVALGGDVADVANLTTTPELLEKISVVAGAGASELPVVKKADAGKVLTVNGNGKWAAIMPESELPAVSGADDGKVLGVVSGAWGKMNAQSGGDPFIATFSGSNGATCDKTFAEIKAAIDAGRAVFASITSSNIDVNPGSLFPVSYYSSEIIGFSCYYAYGDDYVMMGGNINSNGLSYFVSYHVNF